MADAGTSLDGRHERQESQHGQLPETSVGLERVEIRHVTLPVSALPHNFFFNPAPDLPFIPAMKLISYLDLSYNILCICHGLSFDVYTSRQTAGPMVDPVVNPA